MTPGLIDTLQAADTILCNNIAAKQILKWIENPSSVSFQLGKALFASRGKIQNNSKIFTPNQYMTSLVNAWKNCYKFKKLETLGNEIVDHLIKTYFIDFNKSNRISDSLSNIRLLDIFIDAIKMPRFINPNNISNFYNKHYYIDNWYSGGDFQRVRNLLKALRNVNNPSLPDRVINYVYCNPQKELYNSVFIVNDNNANKCEKLLNQVNVLSEVLMEMSYHTINRQVLKNLADIYLTQWSETHLKNTNNLYSSKSGFVPVSSTFIKASEHNTASVFVTLFNPSDREKILQKIYDDLKGYSGTWYPLAYLIAGCIDIERHVPPKERQGLLAERLANYRGIFEEDVSAELKQLYFDSLCNGSWCDPYSLIEILSTLYHRESTPREWKDKISNMLSS
jgi:hypothetical protein